MSYNLKVAAMLDHFINALLTRVNLSDKKLTETVERLMSTPRISVRSKNGSIIAYYDRISAR